MPRVLPSRDTGSGATHPTHHTTTDTRGLQMTDGPNTPPMGEPPDAGEGAQSGGTPPPPPPGQPAPGGGQPQAASGEPADLLTRFLAKLIDGVLLGIAYAILVAFFVFSLLFNAAAGGPFMGGGNGYLASLVGTVLSTAIFLGYYAFLEANRGQTVGKMLLNIKVVGPDGGNPTMEQAVKRNAYFALSLLGIIPFIGGFLSGVASLVAVIAIAVTINNNAQTRQGWHDEFAGGTHVIKVA